MGKYESTSDIDTLSFSLSLSLHCHHALTIARSHDIQYLSRARHDLRIAMISRVAGYSDKKTSNVVFPPPRFLFIVPEARSLRLWSRPKNDGSINLPQFMLKALNRMELITRLISFFFFFRSRRRIYWARTRPFFSSSFRFKSWARKKNWPMIGYSLLVV